MVYVLKVCRIYCGAFVFGSALEKSRTPRRGPGATESPAVDARARPRARRSVRRSRRWALTESRRRARAAPADLALCRRRPSRRARRRRPRDGGAARTAKFARNATLLERGASRRARRDAARDATRAGVTNAARPCATPNASARWVASSEPSTLGPRECARVTVTVFFWEVSALRRVGARPHEDEMPCAQLRSSGTTAVRRCCRRSNQRAPTDWMLKSIQLDRASHETVRSGQSIPRIDELCLSAIVCF